MFTLKPLRLDPNTDVRKFLQLWCTQENVKAGFIISSVGSLSQTNIRLANSEKYYQSKEPHELIHLSGLISSDGVHLHLSVSDKNGSVTGGHLSENNLVHTTLEMIIGIADQYEFLRILDAQTGYKELKIKYNPT